MKYVTQCNTDAPIHRVIGFFDDETLAQLITRFELTVAASSCLLPTKSTHSTLFSSPDDNQCILFIHCGKKDEYTLAQHISTLSQAIIQLNAHSLTSASFSLPTATDVTAALQLKQTVFTLEQSEYQFEQLKSKATQPAGSLHTIQIDEAEQPTVIQAIATSKGVTLCKNLGNLPANICTPSYLATEANRLAKDHNSITTKVLDEATMKELGMGALLSVSAGSLEPAQLIEMHYNGAKNDTAPIILVGKGITFDSGGLSLKPPAAMMEMKYDMCGAATVLGVMKAVAEMNLPIHLIGLVAASENLPSGRATKPGDVVTSLSKQTIEILNTDAEGRLVLSDTLTYAERFKPSKVIDIATLTGAAIVALGHKTNALMSNNQALANELLQAANTSQDKAWQLPIWQEYQELLDSNVADMSNISSDKSAGTITAGCFLARFTENYAWAHIDCAGTAWVPGKNKSATGRPVPMLCEFLIGQCQ